MVDGVRKNSVTETCLLDAPEGQLQCAFVAAALPGRVVPASASLTIRVGRGLLHYHAARMTPLSRRRNGPPNLTQLTLSAALVTTLLAAACSRAVDPSIAVERAQVLLEERKVAEAARLLADTAQAFPQDPVVRIELGRVQIAAGEYSSAEGALQRALQLGAAADDVVVPLAESLMAQGQFENALELIAKPETHAAMLRFPLSVLYAECLLRLQNNDKRLITKAFVAAYRQRAAESASRAPNRDWRSADERLGRLEAEAPVVAAAYQHYSCKSSRPESLQVTTDDPRSPNDAPQRRVLRVGPGRDLKRPSDAARIAADGDIIEIDAAAYRGDVASWPQSNLLLRGIGGRPHLDARGRSANEQGIWVFSGSNIVVENIEFSGAKAASRNGSGIRFLGQNLTIRDCVFYDNENGVLTWNDPESDVLIERSVFYRNGYGDGQSHNIYVGQMRSFTLRFSYSHDSRKGHEVKSRARVNRVLYNGLADEDNGDSSYLVNFPEGGEAYVVGNVMRKGTLSDNPNAISYAEELPEIATGQLWVVNNSLLNSYPYGTFVRNAGSRPALVANNVIAGAPMLVLSGTGRETSNRSGPGPGLTDPVRMDFSLTEASPLIDAGTEEVSGLGPLPVPEFEYVHPAGGRPRQRVGPIDIGAQEFCGW